MKATTYWCDRPPPGWRCTRAAGHEGPCAAHPSIEEVDRLIALIEAQRAFVLLASFNIAYGHGRGTTDAKDRIFAEQQVDAGNLRRCMIATVDSDPYVYQITDKGRALLKEIP